MEIKVVMRKVVEYDYLVDIPPKYRPLIEYLEKNNGNLEAVGEMQDLFQDLFNEFGVFAQDIVGYKTKDGKDLCWFECNWNYDGRIQPN